MLSSTLTSLAFGVLIGGYGVVAADSTSAPAATSTQINSQLRLAYAGHNGMTVSWNTDHKLKQPRVHYGLHPNKLNQVASSDESVTYETSLTYNNHVTIHGLRPNTKYYYLPEHLLNMAHTPYTFTTSRESCDHDPFSVAVVVDMGTFGPRGLTTTAGKGVSSNNTLKPGEINTIESLEKNMNGFDFVWHPGDIAYADYWLKEMIQGFLPQISVREGYKVFENILNDYYDEFTGVTAHKPYMVGPGNHEATCDNGGTTDKAANITYDISICMPGQLNFTGYRNHFRMPSKQSHGTGNFWYSFDHGMVHFVQLDTETDLGHGLIGNDEPGGTEGMNAGPFNKLMDAQTKWLENDLKKVDRKKTPWVIAAGHRPWYLSHSNSSGTICWSCKDVFEPLLIKYGVDLVLSGHSHVYERQAPLADSKIDPAELNNPKAPWYITNGAAGHYDGLDSLDSPRKPYSRFGLDTLNATYGWSKLTFHNKTHLTHDFVASKSGQVLDSATLYKKRS